MLRVKDVLRLPPLLRKRLHKIHECRVVWIRTKDLGNTIDSTAVVQCRGSAQSHTTRIVLYKENKPKNLWQLKVTCDCPSFWFEFAYWLEQHDSLLNPVQLQRPKKKNPYGVIALCKHLYTHLYRLL